MTQRDREPHDRSHGDPAVAVVVPIRSFAGAKSRLAPVLDADARADLARRMADRVVDAAGSLPVVVVSSAPEVTAWAAGRGLAVVADPGTLDGAADAGRDWARARGCGRVVVAHGDLPRAVSLDAVATDADTAVAVIVPDRRDDGTPVLSVPTASAFRFAYGPQSAARHTAEAERCGLEVRLVRDPALAFDVDVPADYAALRDLTDEPVA